MHEQCEVDDSKLARRWMCIQNYGIAWLWTGESKQTMTMADLIQVQV